MYGFPEEALHLALDMYRAPRRIRCGAAYSQPVLTNMGVLAGCPIAMGLLLLASIDPIETFMKSVPKQLDLLMVYVDDLNLTFTFKDTEDVRYGKGYIAFQVNSTYRRLHAQLFQPSTIAGSVV